jgi:hypothetical protein
MLERRTRTLSGPSPGSHAPPADRTSQSAARRALRRPSAPPRGFLRRAATFLGGLSPLTLPSVYDRCQPVIAVVDMLRRLRERAAFRAVPREPGVDGVRGHSYTLRHIGRGQPVVVLGDFGHDGHNPPEGFPSRPWIRSSGEDGSESERILFAEFKEYGRWRPRLVAPRDMTSLYLGNMEVPTQTGQLPVIGQCSFKLPKRQVASLGLWAVHSLNAAIFLGSAQPRRRPPRRSQSYNCKPLDIIAGRGGPVRRSYFRNL